MWSGIKAQQNGMKELILSTDTETERWGEEGGGGVQTTSRLKENWPLVRVNSNVWKKNNNKTTTRPFDPDLPRQSWTG